MVSFSDITVVVQGPVHPFDTPKCIESIHRHMPGAEVIVSTWNDADVSCLRDLKVDTLIRNEDPPSIDNIRFADFIYAKDEHTKNTVNKQLRSTLAGIERATRSYCLKIRSDAYIVHTGFIAYFDIPLKRDERYTVFGKHIVVINAFSPRRMLPFMVGDHFYFGRTEDLRYCFDIKPCPSDEYLNNLPQSQIDTIYGIIEHYMTREALGKKFHIPQITHMTRSRTLEQMSEKLIANNFICLNVPHYGIISKYWRSKPPERTEEQHTEQMNAVYMAPLYNYPYVYMCTFYEWIDWYIMHCGGSVNEFPERIRAEYASHKDFIDVLRVVFDHELEPTRAEHDTRTTYISMDPARVEMAVKYMARIGRKDIIAILKNIVTGYNNPAHLSYYKERSVFTD